MNSRKTVQESFTDVGDAMNAFGDVLKQILGIPIDPPEVIHLSPDEYEIFDEEDSDGSSSQPGLPHGSV